MTEAKWLACTDPIKMMRFLRGKVSRRKSQLYLCGGCRHIAHLFYDPASGRAVEVAERDADGLASGKELGDASYSAECPTFGYDFEEEFQTRFTDDPVLKEYTKKVLTRLVEMGALSESVLTGGAWRVNKSVRDRLVAAAEIAWRCMGDGFQHPQPKWWYVPFREAGWPGRWLIDCVFGNPFRPATADSRWLTSTVVSLAQTTYAERAFDRLPILADALDEAGCDQPDLLAHCRSDGPHVRGCWAVDLILGKA